MGCGTDPAQNLERAVELTREAARLGANVVCHQELFLTQYFCRVQDPRSFGLAESVPGPTTGAMSRLARELGVVIVVPLFERAGARFYDTAVIIDADGSLAGKYRKTHLPEEPLYHEKFYFSPGDLGFRAHDTRFGRIGVLVCWDQWFPEAARLTALDGADVLLYPTAIGWSSADRDQYGEADLSAWETVQRGHAISNGVYVVAANRTGREGPPGQDIQFWGSSFAVDPHGRVVARASRDGQGVLVVDIDPWEVAEAQRQWPFFRDRRVDAYGGLVGGR